MLQLNRVENLEQEENLDDLSSVRLKLSLRKCTVVKTFSDVELPSFLYVINVSFTLFRL